jgi:hypothetical protein
MVFAGSGLTWQNTPGDMGIGERLRKEDRCDAHVWITMLAYHLLRWIEYSLKLAGVDCACQEVCRLLQTHCYTTINLPCGNGSNYQVRRPGKPDERQKVIYAAFGINVGALPVRKVVVEPSPAGGA